MRIIGGRWRGTRLPVAQVAGLRPSPDRVRETLFNWLQPMLPGARVLDVFAGTGALGLEAVSRGAAYATLLERDAAAVGLLNQAIGKLRAHDQVQLVAVDALDWLGRRTADAYDIALVDPPFHDGAMAAVLPLLFPALRDHAWLYLETAPDGEPSLPQDWHLHRDGHTRDVHYALYRRAS